MLRTLLFFLPSLAMSASPAIQSEGHLSAVTKRYEAYRNAVTEPDYGLAKVKALIKKIRPDKEYNQRLPAKKFNALSFDEKFTYTMLHGEDQSQNCDEMPSVVGSEHKIFCYPAPFNDTTAWSERQESYLKDNRPRILALLRQTIRTHHRVGINLKAAILDLGADELIPDLLTIYDRNKKDQDILSVCAVLMKEAKYKPFLDSAVYQTLYGENSNYKGYIEATRETRSQIERLAISFSKSAG